MCEYCEEHEVDDGYYGSYYGVKLMNERQRNSKYNIDSFIGIDISINQENELKLFAVLDGKNIYPLSLEKTVKINYCPMCGRKLDK